MKNENNDAERYSGTIIRDVGSERYIRKNPAATLSVGLIKSFWMRFMNELEQHVNYEYNKNTDPLGECDPDIGDDNEYEENQCEDTPTKLIVSLSDLGTARSIGNSQNPSSADRVAGSKHGAGLALDINISSRGPDAVSMFQESGLDPANFAYLTHNEVLAKNAKLVRAIRSFVNTISSVRWGGDFDGGTGDTVVGRGITEFHHFEIESSEMPAHFEPHRAELDRIGIEINNLTSTSALSDLYTAIAETEDKEYSLLREFILETIK
jgi:hypothetical protein